MSKDTIREPVRTFQYGTKSGKTVIDSQAVLFNNDVTVNQKFEMQKMRDSGKSPQVFGRKTDAKPFKLYALVGSIIEVCSYGTPHEILYFISKTVWETNATREAWEHGGGNMTQNPIYVDGRGALYFQERSVDYYSNMWYDRVPQGPGQDRMRFYHAPKFPSKRPPNGVSGQAPMQQHARNYDGTSLRKHAAAAPDGPAWDQIDAFNRMRRG